ncbi:neural cell adhesion molecule L1 isoform X3 [Anolis carolinensis]|uniref:Neural cell adhesion molecule L1 n=1 Tax=Anolis carolinensis TaxID=28377 RepID=A0A803SND1_ANOCA|nr:PREDICTED: neural cell adhesion molecule L1 isoform X3 [Anolis carolinensis]|eukprot:XP_008102105.1 PREDICTED: neural cell adhesion molecule L1 isoform X3 [Anolis carolinensis]
MSHRSASLQQQQQQQQQQQPARRPRKPVEGPAEAQPQIEHQGLHAVCFSFAVPLPQFGERPWPKVPGKMASTPAYLLMLWPLVLLLLSDLAASIEFPEGYNRTTLPQPPEFSEQPEKELVVFPTDEVTVRCQASGNPPVEFHWTKDGKEFNPNEVPGMTQRKGSGTIVITTNNGNVATKFKGVYRCYATNSLGTAMSYESRIIAESAPQWPKEKVAPITVEEGTHTILPCNPPISAVPPKIYWLNSRIEHIVQDERVTIGQDGNLYFANVQMTDSRPDYICNAHFQGPRVIIQKEPIELKVTTTNTLSHKKPMRIMPEKRQTTYVAKLGESLVLECIVAGLPTPSVEWVHKNRLNVYPNVVFENAKKTLRILNVTDDDDGEYECIATNDHGKIVLTYTVNVEAAPYWIKKPVSQIYAPGESVRLDCEVEGKPKPEVSWRINGIPLEDVMPEKRRKVQPGALIINEVEPNDTAVIQCEAHNKHGSLLANAYILVLQLPAQILTPGGLEYSVVENQAAVLDCMAFGVPRPTVKWITDDKYVLDDIRSFLFTNGTLLLEQVQRQDAGNFTCIADNDVYEDSITARLIVKGATTFEVGPVNTEKKEGETVTFHCKVLFDETIPEHGIKWRRNGKVIQESDENEKYFINDTSLMITNLDYSDQGIYSCLAWTALDSVEKSAKLVVYGKPGPVSNLELLRQQDHQVKLTWTPGDDHNRDIEEYTVFCEESKFKPGKLEELATIPGNQPWAILPLSPFRNYTFYVQSRNNQGKSELSKASANHVTKPAAPDQNPADVRGEGNETTNMIITWTPFLPWEWNAPSLKYHVQWRQENEDQWNETEVEAPPVVVTGTPVFTPYEIKVQARNEFGKGPEPSIELGYSGEDVPEAIPENLAVEVLNSTTIKLSWILPNREKIFGHLKGFQVYFFWLGTMADRSRRQARAHTHSHGKVLIEGDVSEIILGGFRPWSRYRVQMSVLNGRGEGPHSEAIEFGTPEGVPSRPESLHMEFLSNTTVTLEWTPPRFPNGKLLRYVLAYQQANQTSNQTNMGFVSGITIPATQLMFNVSDLDPYTPYNFYLSAETREGSGEAYVLQEHAIRESVNLSLVNITLGDVRENSTTIFWTTRHNQRDVEFAIHIMSKTDKENWQDVGRVTSSQGSYLIPDLEPGKQYRVRLVKEHRTGDLQVIWESEMSTAGSVHESFRSFAAQGWFVGFVSAIVLLVLVLVLLCFIKRSKGGKYSVKDKEDTQVDSEARPMKDETFGEYSDNEEKPFTSSQPSLNGDIKALGSDDSLADYGGSVDVQFNEDGSFIGQYSGQKGKEGGGNDSSGATSPTNVVTALE